MKTNTNREELVKSFKKIIDDLPEKKRREAVGVMNALIRYQKKKDMEDCKRIKTKQKSLL